MLKLSLDNPLIVKIAFLLFGLIGFIFMQLITNQFNYFSLKFVLLSFIEIIFFIYLANILESKQNWNIKIINPIFAIIVITTKLFLVFILLRHGLVDSFDDRLSVYGNSFLIGISMATSFVLFPILPLFGSNIIIRKLSLYLWVISTFISLLYAPSKSALIGIISSLLFYRFLKRKTHCTLGKIPLFSLKSISIFFLSIAGTILFVYVKVGADGIYIILFRIAYNFDVAIYSSQIAETIYPEHSNLYYAILPILKKFNADLYNLEFFSIPQWVIYEYFGYSRYGRYGYPNDNLIVGLLVSYKEFGIILFIFFILIMNRYIKYFKKLKNITLFHLIIIFSIPGIFSSLQDSIIKFYSFIFIYIATIFIYLILPKNKKESIHANNI